MEGFCEEEDDLMGVKLEVAIGVPWKDDLLSKKEDLRVAEREDASVVAMATRI